MSTGIAEIDPFMLGGEDPDRKPYELCPSGAYHAYCVLIWDLGTHDEQFDGQPRNNVRSVLIGWELPEVPMKDGSPFVITKRFGVALDGRSTFGAPNSGLRKIMESWRGKGYTKEQITAGVNLRNMLGKRGTLTVNHRAGDEDKTYHVFGSISQPMKVGDDFPGKPHHEPVIYTLADGDPPSIPWIPMIYDFSLRKLLTADGLTFASKEMRAKYPNGRPGGGEPGTPEAKPAPMTGGALVLDEPEGEPDF